MSKRNFWNRCDICGKFIAIDDFDKGATRNIVSHDSEPSSTFGYHEDYETLCISHAQQKKQEQKK